MSIFGLTRETTPAVFLQGCLEGVTLRIAAIVRLIHAMIQSSLDSRGGDDDDVETVQIICSGNALEVNDLWRQMIADCSGLDVVLDRETQEGTSRGVVKLMQRELLYKGGILSNAFAKEPITSSSTAKPREEARRYWDEAIWSQELFIDAVSPLY